jgi:hypothetical protein
MNQPRHVKGGDVGYDVTAYRRALDRYRNHAGTLPGPNWPEVTDGENYHAVGRSYYDTETKMAVAAVKRRHPFITERGIGALTFQVLAPYIDGWGWKLLRLARPKCPVDPAMGHGEIIGVPYVGTHAGPYLNWESCNAIDISLSVGTPLYAVCAGRIGPQIGPIDASDPKLAGQRLHVVTSANEFYYAHLSRLVVHAGENVRTQQLLGYSGSANGVAHLHFGAHHGDPGLIVGDPSPNYHDHHYPG